jgi:hypothetical protein
MTGRWHRPAAYIGLGGLLAFATYHLVRDVATSSFDVHVGVVDVAHRPHAWCQPICDYVTMPLEAFNIVTIGLVLARRRLGALAVLNAATVPLWLLAWLLP